MWNHGCVRKSVTHLLLTSPAHCLHSAAEWTTLLAHWQSAKMLFVRYGPAAYFPRAVNYVIAVVEVTTCQFNIGSWIHLDNKHI